jgi:hypothetical protein
MPDVRIFSLALALTIPLASCGDQSVASEPPRTQSNAQTEHRVTLAIGQSQPIGSTGLTLALRSVDNDSRCPAGVTCVWAGDADVAITVTRGSAQTPATLHVTLNPHSVDVAGYRVELIELAPQTHSGLPTLKSDYRATFTIKPVRS